MKKLLVPLLVIALAAALAAGCGGKSRNKAYANSLSGYIAALNQICSAANAQIKTLQPQSAAGLVTNGPKIKSIIEDGVGKIENLQPPDKVKSAVDDFVSKSKTEISKLDDLISAAKANDGAKIQQLNGEISTLDDQTNQDAREIGADKCAQSG